MATFQSAREFVPTVASNPRVIRAELSYIGSYLLAFVLGAASIAWVVIGHVNPSTNDTAAGLILGGALLWFVSTMGLYVRHYLLLMTIAIEVPSGPTRGQLPAVVLPATPLGGQEFQCDARVKTMLGRAGRCRIELYTSGIRIWRGPSHSSPSWSFAYSDLLQAETVTLIGGARTPDLAYLRLVAARPPMAFVISSRRQTRELLRRLVEHGVPTVGR